MALYDDTVRQYNVYLCQRTQITNPIHAAAIWGNGGEESAGFTQLHQKGGNGFGGWQWDDRRPRFEQFLREHGTTVEDLKANVDFLIFELLGTENHSLVQLKKTTDLSAATYTFMKLFERPGVEAEDVRLRWAQRALPICIATMEKLPMTDPTTPAPAVTITNPQAAPVDQLALFIKSAELKVEDVLRALLIAKGVPAFIIDFAFAQLNQIDLASMVQHIDLNSLLKNIFQKK